MFNFFSKIYGISLSNKVYLSVLILSLWLSHWLTHWLLLVLHLTWRHLSWWICSRWHLSLHHWLPLHHRICSAAHWLLILRWWNLTILLIHSWWVSWRCTHSWWALSWRICWRLHVSIHSGRICCTLWLLVWICINPVTIVIHNFFFDSDCFMDSYFFIFIPTSALSTVESYTTAAEDNNNDNNNHCSSTPTTSCCVIIITTWL